MERLEWRYIKGITTKEFKEQDIKDSSGQIKDLGWYWADKSDNARYSDWYGAFKTSEEAEMDGQEHRASIVGEFMMQKSNVATFRHKFATLTEDFKSHMQDEPFTKGTVFSLYDGKMYNKPDSHIGVAKSYIQGLHIFSIPTDHVEIEERLLIAEHKVDDTIILKDLAQAIPYKVKDVKCEHGIIFYDIGDGVFYERDVRLATIQEMQRWGRTMRKPSETEMIEITKPDSNDSN